MTNTATLLDTVKQKAQEIKDLRAEHQKLTQQLLADSFKQIFEEYPKVGKVQWTQYTPYFNDGDECVFGVNEWEILSQDELENPDEEYEGRYSYGDAAGDFSTSTYRDQVNKVSPRFYKRPGSDYWSPHKWGDDNEVKENPNYDPQYGEPYEAIKELYKTIDQGTLKEIFGDHVYVAIDREGAHVEEYDHD